MLDTALLSGIALLLGARAAVAPVAATACLALALAFVCRRVHIATIALCLAAFALSLLRARSQLSAFERERLEVRDHIGPYARCEAEATVRSAPARKGAAYRFDADLTRLVCDDRPAPPLRARLYLEGPPPRRGDRLAVITQLGPLQLFVNHDTRDPRPSAARSGVVASGSIIHAEPLGRSLSAGALIDIARAHTRQRIEATFSGDAALLARALVLGEEDLSEELDEAFRGSGLSHLLAVSGSHLVLVVLSLVSATRALLLLMTPLAQRLDVGRIAAGAGVVLSFVYADFAGSSGSAMRAAFMLALLLSARALGRPGDGPRALGLSLWGLLLPAPLASFDLSLLLSAAATAGLMFASPSLETFFAQRLDGPLARLSSPLSATLSALAACTPLLTSMAPGVPLFGIVANLLAVPVGEAFALPLCLLHALLAPLPALERGVALAASGALAVVSHIAHIAASPRFATLPLPPVTEPQAVVLFALPFALAAWPARLRPPAIAVAAALLLSFEALAIRQGAPRDVLRVTSLDVGQGDSALIDMPDGRLMLVDGGGFVGSPVDPGRSVILPTLRARRRKHVDVVVLSHPHPDHFMGLASALPQLSIGELWDTGQGEDEGAGPVYEQLLRGLRARGVVVHRPAQLCGAPRRFGAAMVEVLAPCPAPHPFGHANDNSLVMRVSLGQRRALFVGDAEREEEAELLERERARLGADLLKVGHHGSRTSTSPSFLRAVSPALALVSCGLRNRFGHPHPSTLATLSASGVPTARTDLRGALRWQTDGERISTAQAGD